MPKNLQKLFMLLLPCTLLVTGFLFAAPSTSYAASHVALCNQWREVGTASQFSFANVYVHFFKRTDALNEQCGEFYTHVDVYVPPNRPSLHLVVQVYNNSNYHSVENTATLSTGSSGSWFNMNSPTYSFNGCNITGEGDLWDNNNAYGPPIYAITPSACD